MIENYDEWRYRIALMRIPGVGDRIAKNLIANCGSARAVFLESPSVLLKISGVGPRHSVLQSKEEALRRADQEMEFIDRHQIRPLFYLEGSYPQRLKLCEDGPVVLYTKGGAQFNKRPALAIVGTRSATSYGLDFCEWLMERLVPYEPMIISGLAYGIDIKAHREAMRKALPTAAVLGHSLDRVYPFLHRKEAEEMQQNGALVTEFMSGTKPDRENFPRRNRIVAGMCDAVIVVEAARRGGALITAELANSYNREVFAVPGPLGQNASEGCNQLIKTNKASLISDVADLEYILGWEKKQGPGNGQQQMDFGLENREQLVWQVIHDAGGRLELSRICSLSGLPVSESLQVLMGLELKGIIYRKPGKVYSLKP